MQQPNILATGTLEEVLDDLAWLAWRETVATAPRST